MKDSLNNVYKKEPRDSNIELLRIVLMLMIVLYHLVYHGIYITVHGATMNTMSPIFTFIIVFSSIAVNCFVFISGFYGIKFKSKTFISLIIQGVFYSTALYALNIILGNGWSIESIFTRCFPLFFNKWWFFSVYMALYIVSPILNKGIDKLSKYQLLFLILLLLYLQSNIFEIRLDVLSNSGYSFYSFCIIYMLGRYCNKYQVKFRYPMLLLLFFTGLNLGLNEIMIFTDNFFASILAYSNPIIIISAILFFYCFKKIKLKSSAINKVAQYCFAVYLIHEYHTMRDVLKKIVRYLHNLPEMNTWLLLLILIAMTLTIFIVSIGIEKIRSTLCAPITNRIEKYIEQKFPDLYKQINYIDEKTVS